MWVPLTNKITAFVSSTYITYLYMPLPLHRSSPSASGHLIVSNGLNFRPLIYVLDPLVPMLSICTYWLPIHTYGLPIRLIIRTYRLVIRMYRLVIHTYRLVISTYGINIFFLHVIHVLNTLPYMCNCKSVLWFFFKTYLCAKHLV